MRAVARAPGKVILFGEHFVVYGKPAIVMAIDRYVTVTASRIDEPVLRVSSSDLGVEGVFRNGSYVQLRGGARGDSLFAPVKECVDALKQEAGYRGGLSLRIDSELPMASGLGSSAALAVATVAAVSRVLGLELGRDEINSLAYRAEVVVHGTPSGVDNTVSTYGGVLRFQRDPSPRFRRLELGRPLPLVIGDTRVARSTGRQVSKVRSLYERYGDVLSAVMEAYEALAERAEEALKRGDLRVLGELMSINHGLLWSVGVSSKELDELVNAALRAGALGAKLTGAGGGGCVVALTAPDSQERVAEGIRSAGGRVITASTDFEGVRVYAGPGDRQPLPRR